MPVHRHLHDKRGSVYARGPELDEWLRGRRPYLGEEEEEGRKEQEAGTPEEAAGSHGTGRTPRARLWFVLAAVAVLGLLAVAYVMSRGRPAAQLKIESLAVLPLKNLSGDPTKEYLADGMTDELIGRLSRIHNLRVISRTSVMRFKNPQVSVPEIAKMLRVDAIVEGSKLGHFAYASPSILANRDAGRAGPPHERIHSPALRATDAENVKRDRDFDTSLVTCQLIECFLTSLGQVMPLRCRDRTNIGPEI